MHAAIHQSLFSNFLAEIQAFRRGFIGKWLIWIICMMAAVGNAAGAQTQAEKKDLFRAVQSGDVKQVKTALRYRTDVNATDQIGFSPLMHAALAGKVDIMKVLIAKGANPNFESSAARQSVLSVAVQSKSLEAVKLLIESGVNINQTLGNGQTPLISAATSGDVEMLKMLLAKGAELNRTGGNRIDALSAAVGSGNEQAVEFLISKGAKIESSPEVLWPPINLAAQRGHDKIIRLLLDKGAKIDAVNATKQTALMFAVENGHRSTVELLLSRGADVTLRNSVKDNALEIARKKGKADMVAILEKAMAAAKTASASGPTIADLNSRVAVATTPPNSQTQGPIRVLFIGNSYTYGNDVPAIVKQLAAAANEPRPLETGMIAQPGYNLGRHWDEKAALNEIKRVAWDYVVLQEQSGRTIGYSKEGKNYPKLFSDEIHATGARPVLFVPWASQGKSNEKQDVDREYWAMAKEIGAIIAPVGRAWENALNGKPAIVLHASDTHHANPSGSYLTACVFYSLFYNKSPEGLPRHLVDPGDTNKVLVSLIPADATRLQRVAWETLQSPP